MDDRHFRNLIVRPVCKHIGMWAENSENLMVGTALTESGGLKYITQLNGGPARGPFQQEPISFTHVLQYLDRKPELRKLVMDFASSSIPLPGQLIWNFGFATAMARVYYWTFPEPLPDADDLRGMANYYKKYWNTELGAATPELYIRWYRRYH